MTIGIDITTIQGPHRMRGIGYTLINFINNLSEDSKQNNTFVFYMLSEIHSDIEDPLSVLDLKNINYRISILEPERKLVNKFSGRLSIIISILNSFIEISSQIFGDSRFNNIDELDAFIQADQSKSLPRGKNLKKFLIIYDLIPFVAEWDYLWSYRTARKVKGFSRKASLRCHARRKMYFYKLRFNIKKADLLFAISEVTKRDFIKTFHVKDNFIKVVSLGINKPSRKIDSLNRMSRYVNTSWGYMSREFDLDLKVPYLLFVGGADKRRKLQDLVSAYNHLRGEGIDIKLILAGDSMKGPGNISNEEVQWSLKTSSYLDDIIFLGFINDSTRDWLYRNSLAFIFPSMYEGFGLPVLEAMSYGTPVITYRNDATLEVAKHSPIYVDNSKEIANAVKRLINDKAFLRDHSDIGLKESGKFTWEDTSQKIIDILQYQESK